MGRRGARFVIVLLISVCSTALVVDAQQTRGKEDRAMSADVTAELTRLRRNEAVLLAAINRIIADTAPIALANPADSSSGYVTTGLVLDAEGVIVPGRIEVPGPQFTLRGVRPGDPLWEERPGSP